MSRHIPPAYFAVALFVLIPLGEATAQVMTYGQCADRARDRYIRGQVDPTIGADRALQVYTGDLRECARLDAEMRARDTRQDQQRVDQQRRDQQLDQQRADQQRLDQQRTEQRLDQQRLDQQRDDALRQRQRDDARRYPR